ncbi:hypothetical protein BGZ63DRAFT_394496 [Mariannaea sp. PMI_226]|nr:hypothetical protein BGZ63DRAFT_394496 [Mariannaea sp. PMI_226]
MKTNLARWSLPLRSILLCQLWARLALADKVGTFTYPADNGLIFYDGETINASWTSRLSNASLTLFCRNGTESEGATFVGMSAATAGRK